MSGVRITIDGLWRCLCPSIDAVTLSSTISVPYRPQLASRCPAAKSACARPRVTTRALHTTRRQLQNGADMEVSPAVLEAEAQEQGGGAPKLGNADSARPQDGPPKASDGSGEPIVAASDAVDNVEEDRSSETNQPQGAQSLESSVHMAAQEPVEKPTGSTSSSSDIKMLRNYETYDLPKRARGTVIERIVDMEPPYTELPTGATNSKIMETIRYIRQRGHPRWRRLTAVLLKHLLNSSTPPNTFIYETLLIGHALREGSADVAKSLLQEMRMRRVPWSQTAYHAVIRICAIHPDYLLRNDVIREMKERWIEILPKGHRYIALGLLRDEQYELALEKLDEMIRNGIAIDSWVFDIFTYVFGKLEFLDDAFRITRHRVDRGYQVPVNIWYFLLDVCSQGQNHEATVYIWNRTVQQGLVNPSDGVALNILNMAAAYGNTELATQVIQYLAERGTKLSRPHYEALADAYIVQGKVDRAVEVYCIMHGAGTEVNHSAVGSFCQALSRDPSLVDQALQAMSELKNRYKVPIGIFNAVLHAMANSNTPSNDETFARVLNLYRRVRNFVETGPDVDTFKNLLWTCTRPDIAQFFAGEMVAFKIRQTLVIMELMFKVHVQHQGPTHRAIGYFFKIAQYLRTDYVPGSRRWQKVMDLSVELVKRLVAERNPLAWRILDVCQKNGLEEDRIKALREEVEAGKITMADTAGLPRTDGQELDWRPLNSAPAAES